MLSRSLALALIGAALGIPAAADTKSVLFVGNSYTFGRVDPVMSYNTNNVRDLTRAGQPGRPSFDNTAGSNVFEPHPWAACQASSSN